MKAPFLVFLIILFWAASPLADPRSSFDEGLRLYRSNDMDGAITHWENVLRQGAVSGPLLFNLGNAYYKSDRIGKAILCYERARKLSPRDRDIMTNLDLARLATVDKLEKPVRLIIWDWIDRVRDYLALHELATAFAVLGFVSLGAFFAWRSVPERWRRMVYSVLIVSLIFYGLFGMWYGWRAVLDSRVYGIMTETKVDVFSAPDASSKQLFSLHEGTKIRIGEVLSGWISVQLPDHRKGWVPVGSVEKI